MSTLAIYKNLTPNLKNGKHYLFSDFAAFKTAIASKLFSTISVDNFRYTTEEVKIALSQTFTISDVDAVTYIIYEETGFHRCHYVEKAVVKSGFVVFSLSLDLWANHIDKAALSSINVIKCNREIAEGFYEEPNPTNARTATSIEIPNFTQTIGSYVNYCFDSSKVCIVFALEYNYYQTLSGSVTQTKLFRINLQALKRYYVNLQGNANDKLTASWYNAVDLALCVVGGIYGLSAKNGWGIETTTAARVIGAWIVESTYTIASATMLTGIKTNNEMTGDLTFSNTSGIVEEVITMRSSRTFDLGKLDAQKVYYFGTEQNFIKLDRRIGSTIVYIDYVMKNDGVNVLARQGDNTADITTAFAVNVTTTAGDITAQRQIKDALNMSVRLVGAAVGLKKGNEAIKLASAMSFMQSTSGILTADTNKGMGNHLESGDGATSWRFMFDAQTIDPARIEENITYPVKNPYALISFESIEDEVEITKRRGAIFDAYVSSLASIFTSSYIEAGTSETYVQANANVEGVPLMAANFIKAELQAGIYLENLT